MTETPLGPVTLLTPQEAALPAIDQVLLAAPIYTKFSAEEYPGFARKIFDFDGRLDAYCPGCGRHSVFQRADGDYFDTHSSVGKFSLRFDCSRLATHEMVFLFMVEDGIQKLGQYPSVAELSSGDDEKYAKVLGKERYREFKRATGLAAHGIGVGSFVYLRRIFEGLIAESYEAARVDTSWDETEWQSARMDGKILLLRDQLPDFLVAQRGMYGILSRGIHELSESECLSYFDVVKGAIEIILDAKLEQRAKAEKQAKIEKQIQAVQQILKS